VGSAWRACLELSDRAGPGAIARAGAKAATLAGLARAGLPVPDGLVVDAEWFAAWQASEVDGRWECGVRAGAPSARVSVVLRW
jgi:hypothetical protein